ncbi:ISL3 family transposase [Thiolapillus sp.]
MYDLLQLDGVMPIGMREEPGYLLVIAESILPPPQICENCGHSPLYKHGKRRYAYADTPVHGKPVKVEIEHQRYRCKACGTVVTPTSDSLDEKRVATKRLVHYVQDRCFGTTLTWLSKEIGLAINTVKNIARDYIEYLENLTDRETPRLMGMDELHILGNGRCVLVNLEMHTMFEMLDSRTKKNLIPYFQNLKDKERIEWVVIDIWKPYEVVIGQQLLQAKIVIDKFHVVSKASDKLEKLRMHLQSQMTADDRIHLKKYLRWALLKGERNRTESDWEKIEYIKKHYPDLAMALELKEQFYGIYNQSNRAEGEKAFQNWKDAIPRNFRKYYGEVANMVDRHHRDIFNYYDCPITNGYTEAMNGVVRAMNRLGRGYSFEMLRAKALYYRILRESGMVVTHSSANKDITKPVSTLGKKTARNFGPSISTMESVLQREDES